MAKQKEDFAPNVKLEKAQVRVRVSRYNGGPPKLDVRHVWDNEGEWLPTKKGVNVPVDEAPILIAAMIEAYNAETGGTLKLEA